MIQFGDKIKAARKVRGMTQRELADAVGVTIRTIQLYETNDRQPKNATAIVKLARALHMDVNYFLSPEELAQVEEQERFMEEAEDKYGSRGRAQARMLLDQTSALFAGGELSDEDKEAFFRTMSEIYFDSKDKAKKFSPKKGAKTGK